VDAKLTQQKIKSAVKRLLKNQNLTYADLSKVWDCSLPTVKRQLGPEELPLSRLMILLEWLNINLGDLHKLLESEDLERPQYTAKQNEFLAKNPREFSFLMKLYEPDTPEQIAKKYKLTPQVLEKILIHLEKFDLIKIGAGGKVKPAYSEVPRLNGLLAEAHMRRIIDRGGQFQKNKVSEDLAARARGREVHEGRLSWSIKEISVETYHEYKERFMKLLEEMASVSKIEEKTSKKSQLKIAVVSCSLFLCEPDDVHLPLVRDVMAVGLEEA
jgi:hypothetical protein